MKILFTALTIIATTVGSAAELIGYTYDSAGRLTAAQYGSGKSASWHYDGAGNLTRSANTVIVDSDNDSMADAWEDFHFKTRERDGSGDFDNDGFSDLAEFLASTVPTDPNSLLRMHQTVTNNVVQTTVSWSAISGVKYRVQYKDDPGGSGWNDLPGDVTASGATASKVDVTSAGKPRRFYRVQIVL